MKSSRSSIRLLTAFQFVLICFLLGSSSIVFSQDIILEEKVEQAELGKNLFRSNCAACHNRNMKDDLTGPALAGLEERWKDYPQEDLYNYIRNSKEMLEQQHPRAVELWEAWEPTVMNSFDLTDEEIEAILQYIEAVQNPKYYIPPATEVIGPSTKPYPGFSITTGLNKSEIQSIEEGQIAYDLPVKMVVGQTERITVRIAKGDTIDQEQLILSPTGDEPLAVASLEVGQQMQVRLYNPQEDPVDPFFTIQLNGSTEIKTIEEGRYTQWDWSVKPNRKGEAPLKLVAYISENGNSLEREVFEEIVLINSTRRHILIPYSYLAGLLVLVLLGLSYRMMLKIAKLRKTVEVVNLNFGREEVEKIEGLLKKDQIETALDTLYTRLKSTNYQNEVALLMAKMERIKKERNSTLITLDQYDVKRSQINQAVLDLLKKISS